MEVELLTYTPEPAKVAGMAAAICTGSTNYERSLRAALASGHDSVLEHVSFTFRISGISRVTLAQLTRHRIASFSVESQRYAGAESDTVVPETIEHSEEAWHAYYQATTEAMNCYEWMIAHGVPEQDARYVVPQGCKTQLILTMNARELGHFFALRCCNRAQWEIRAMADMMLMFAKDVFPEAFALSGPGCVRGHCPEGKRACGHPRTELRE